MDADWSPSVFIRDLRPEDSIEKLATLLHAAYRRRPGWDRDLVRTWWQSRLRLVSTTKVAISRSPGVV